MNWICSSKRWLAVCGIGLATVVGCTRHGLQSRATDASASPSGPEVQDALVRDLPTDPQGEAWEASNAREVWREDLQIEPRLEPGPEAGPEPEREAGPETGPDSSLEVGVEVGLEAGSEAGVDASSETGSEPGPPACTPASKDPRTLAKPSEESFVSALVVLGDTAFVGMQSPGSTGGVIVAASLSTGAQAIFPLSASIATQIVAVPGALFFSPGKVRVDDAGTYNYEYTEVARLDLASKKVSIVDSSPAATTSGVGAVVGNANGEVFWTILANEAGHSVIKRWNEATHAPETVMTWGQSLSPLVDRDHFYWSELNSSHHVVFRSVPTVGGTITQLYESMTTFADAPSLAAVDDQRLYYDFPTGSGTGIMAMPKDGGESQTVVPKAKPLMFSSRSIDDSHVYWTEQSDQATIRRIPKTGSGDSEIFWSADSRWVAEIAVDACNVYWTAYNPTEILVRGK